jgi:hypothetical protein
VAKTVLRFEDMIVVLQFCPRAPIARTVQVERLVDREAISEDATFDGAKGDYDVRSVRTLFAKGWAAVTESVNCGG